MQRTTKVGCAWVCVCFFLGSFVVGQAHGQAGCLRPSVTIVGAEQPVFTYQTDKCSKNDFPDVPAMAFVDKNGKVQLLAGNANGNYRSIGKSLTELKRDCQQGPVLRSNPNQSALPEEFYNRVWLTAPWTSDGQTIYALVHNEFDAWLYPTDQYCKSSDHQKCWYPNAVQAVSYDAGKTYQIMRTADGKVQPAIVTPYRYIPDRGQPGIQQGMVAQSNILSQQGADGKTYYYVLVDRGIGHGNQAGTCLFRSANISDPAAWRGWDGKDFTVAMNNNPYTDKIDASSHICTPIFNNFYCENWTYNTVLHQYLAICRSNHFKKDNEFIEAFVYSLSEDKVHWSPPSFLQQINWITTFRTSQMSSGVTGQAYASLLDHGSKGRNFEYSGANPYLYYTRFNPKMLGQPWQDRDLVRVPLKISCE